MNKVILMGRLTRDPELKYTKGAEPVAVVNFSLAANRRFKRQGEQEVDFISCVAFGKNAEFVSKYFHKRQLVSIVGRLNVNSYEDKDGKRRTAVNVVVEENYFAESKKTDAENNGVGEGFYPIDENVEDGDLPF